MKFIEPTLLEVIAYMQYIGLTKSDAEEFYDYELMVGWTVGRTHKPMKDWQAGCRNWKRMQKKFQQDKIQATQPPKIAPAPRGGHYVTASNERGTPMPEELRGLFKSDTIH